ncbi:hypothetical protein PHISCL_00099 [Aspergillus sclerotialis]|uniref:DUF1212 domain membrane protein n=1 Tax=Aspergillus sclerotialis TaxID=2070753 RepID=A0A3A2ZYU1_9EURO|nr:hypothetical protein PHISCL_00099 [Aspergillus sclerotialis]
MVDREFDGGVSRPPSPVVAPNSSPCDSDDNENGNVEQEVPEQREPPQTEAPRGARVRFQSVERPESPRPSPNSDSFLNQRIGSESPEHPSRPLLPSSQTADLADVRWTEPSDSEQRRRSFVDDDSIQADDEKENVQRTESTRGRLKAAGDLVRQKTVRFTERLGRPTDQGEALYTSVIPDDLMGIPLDDYNNEKPKHDEETAEPREPGNSAEAHRLVRNVTRGHFRRRKPRGAYVRSGQSTPENLLSEAEQNNRPRPKGGGILSQLLKLYSRQPSSKDSVSSATESDSETQVSSGAATPGAGTPGTMTPGATTPPFGATTPPFGTTTSPFGGTGTPKKQKIKWYKKPQHSSTASLVGASMNLSHVSLPQTADAWTSSQPRAKKNRRRNTRLEDEIGVTVHIAEILARQRYIMQLCRALMRYGAPTHRLEEYMQMTARVLEISGQFLYLPGCMIMSFDDPVTRTAEVKLVRMMQGVDLGRLADTHRVYKNVVHDMIGVEEASQELADIMNRKPRFNKWMLVPIYGLASATVGPFAFGARPIDMPIIFFLGALLGLMQHVLAPRSVLYSNVFEVTAAVLTSFLARAFGSIRNSNGDFIFCFSAISQSSIALILPGFLVLCSSLELQSHQIIAGSIRMVYALIYSLFLGYGITVGTTIFGLMDEGASSDTTCPGLDVWRSEYARRFPFVGIFCLLLAVINQGKWKQMPVMIFIGVSGYVTNYMSTKRLGSRSEVANTVGAFTIGVLGNLYSRLWHGHAATAILPGIFVLVPSGLASSGSLIAGIEYANAVKNHTAGTDDGASSGINNASLSSLGFGMIQVAIGITVGLFIAALVVYPYGKRRSGLFSF